MASARRPAGPADRQPHLGSGLEPSDCLPRQVHAQGMGGGRPPTGDPEAGSAGGPLSPSLPPKGGQVGEAGPQTEPLAIGGDV